MNKYTENLFDAIKLTAESIISNLSFDKTIVCSIVNIQDRSKRIYTITDGPSKFTAIGNEDYAIGDNVYVLIPQGDYNQQKTIIGKKQSNEEITGNLSKPFDQIIPLFSHLSSNNEYQLIANGGDKELEIFSLEKLNLENYSLLGVSSIFNILDCNNEIEKNLYQEIKSGTYGIIINVIGISKNTEQPLERNYILNNDSFFGNSYLYLEDGNLQEFAFDISEFKKITSLKMIFHQLDDFEYSYFDEKQDKDIVENLPTNIKQLSIKNIKLILGNNIKDYKNNDLIISDYQNNFNYSLAPGEDEKEKTIIMNFLRANAKQELYNNNKPLDLFYSDRPIYVSKNNELITDINNLILVYKEQEENLISVGIEDDEDGLTDLNPSDEIATSPLRYSYFNYLFARKLISIDWFKYKIDENIEDNILGNFWEKQPSQSNPFIFNFTPINEYREKIKSLISFKGQLVLENFGYKSDKSIDKKLNPYSPLTEIDITNTITSLERQYTLEGYTCFTNFDNLSSLDFLDDTIIDLNPSDENVKNREYLFIAATKKEGEEKYSPAAAVWLQTELTEPIVILSNELIYYNSASQLEVKNSINLIKNLTLECTDVENGYYYKYGPDNSISASEASQTRKIEAKFSIISSEGLFVNDPWIQWAIPANNTMIESPKNWGDPIDGWYYSPIKQIVNKEVDLEGVEKIPKNTLNIGDTDQEIKIVESLDYQIKKIYTAASNNNIIKCTVWINNHENKNQQILYFGPVSTNGTKYTFDVSLGERYQNLKETSADGKIVNKPDTKNLFKDISCIDINSNYWTKLNLTLYDSERRPLDLFSYCDDIAFSLKNNEATIKIYGNEIHSNGTNNLIFEEIKIPFFEDVYVETIGEKKNYYIRLKQNAQYSINKTKQGKSHYDSKIKVVNVNLEDWLINETIICPTESDNSWTIKSSSGPSKKINDLSSIGLDFSVLDFTGVIQGAPPIIDNNSNIYISFIKQNEELGFKVIDKLAKNLSTENLGGFLMLWNPALERLLLEMFFDEEYFNNQPYILQIEKVDYESFCFNYFTPQHELKDVTVFSFEDNPWVNSILKTEFLQLLYQQLDGYTCNLLVNVTEDQTVTLDYYSVIEERPIDFEKFNLTALLWEIAEATFYFQSGCWRSFYNGAVKDLSSYGIDLEEISPAENDYLKIQFTENGNWIQTLKNIEIKVIDEERLAESLNSLEEKNNYILTPMEENWYLEEEERIINLNDFGLSLINNSGMELSENDCIVLGTIKYSFETITANLANYLNQYGVILETSLKKLKSSNLKEKDLFLINYFPIPISTNIENYDLYQGADKIIYNSFGNEASYYKSTHFLKRFKDEDFELTWSVYVDDQENTDIRYPIFDKDLTLKIPTLYIDQDYKNKKISIVIQDNVLQNILYVQPLLIIQNSYENSLLNEWDEKLSIKTNSDSDTSSVILSTILGAGTKNNNNQFSGVLFGDLLDNYTSSDKKTGLFGFLDGIPSFGFRTDGTAFLGTSNSGRINFDGTQGQIYSYNYQGSNSLNGNNRLLSLKDCRGSSWNLQTSTFELYGDSPTEENPLTCKVILSSSGLGDKLDFDEQGGQDPFFGLYSDEYSLETEERSLIPLLTCGKEKQIVEIIDENGIIEEKEQTSIYFTLCSRKGWEEEGLNKDITQKMLLLSDSEDIKPGSLYFNIEQGWGAMEKGIIGNWYFDDQQIKSFYFDRVEQDQIFGQVELFSGNAFNSQSTYSMRSTNKKNPYEFTLYVSIPHSKSEILIPTTDLFSIEKEEAKKVNEIFVASEVEFNETETTYVKETAWISNNSGGALKIILNKPFTVGSQVKFTVVIDASLNRAANLIKEFGILSFLHLFNTSVNIVTQTEFLLYILAHMIQAILPDILLRLQNSPALRIFSQYSTDTGIEEIILARNGTINMSLGYIYAFSSKAYANAGQSYGGISIVFEKITGVKDADDLNLAERTLIAGLYDTTSTKLNLEDNAARWCLYSQTKSTDSTTGQEKTSLVLKNEIKLKDTGSVILCNSKLSIGVSSNTLYLYLLGDDDAIAKGGIAYNKDSLYISEPDNTSTNGTVTLGAETRRWKNLYSLQGNFSTLVSVNSSRGDLGDVGYDVHNKEFSIRFGIGSGKTNRGIYDMKGPNEKGLNTWMIAYDKNNYLCLNGNNYVLPGAPDAYKAGTLSLGSSTYRWDCVFSKNGNFSGDISSGTLHLTSTADADWDADTNMGALQIGTLTGQHMRFDTNEIICMANKNTRSTLYIQALNTIVRGNLYPSTEDETLGTSSNRWAIVYGKKFKGGLYNVDGNSVGKARDYAPFSVPTAPGGYGVYSYASFPGSYKKNSVASSFDIQIDGTESNLLDRFIIRYTRGNEYSSGTTSNTGVVIQVRNDSSANEIFRPLSHKTMGLGTSSNQWGSIHGTNYYKDGSAFTSDKRLKTIQPYEILEKDLMLYNLLTPVVYKYKNFNISDDYSRTHIGFFAQDVEQLIRQVGLSSEDCALIQALPVDDNLDIFTDGKKYYLNYNELHGLHVLKNHQQDTEIASLKEEIKQLKQKISKLESIKS